MSIFDSDETIRPFSALFDRIGGASWAEPTQDGSGNILFMSSDRRVKITVEMASRVATVSHPERVPVVTVTIEIDDYKKVLHGRSVISAVAAIENELVGYSLTAITSAAYEFADRLAACEFAGSRSIVEVLGTVDKIKEIAR